MTVTLYGDRTGRRRAGPRRQSRIGPRTATAAVPGTWNAYERKGKKNRSEETERKQPPALSNGFTDRRSRTTVSRNGRNGSGVPSRESGRVLQNTASTTRRTMSDHLPVGMLTNIMITSRRGRLGRRNRRRRRNRVYSCSDSAIPRRSSAVATATQQPCSATSDGPRAVVVRALCHIRDVYTPV